MCMSSKPYICSNPLLMILLGLINCWTELLPFSSLIILTHAQAAAPVAHKQLSQCCC